MIHQNILLSGTGPEPLKIDEDDSLVAGSWAAVCGYYASLAIHDTVSVTVNAASALSVYLKVGFKGPNIGAYQGRGRDVNFSRSRFLKE